MVIKDPNVVADLRSLCDSPSETIQHVIAWCPKLAKNTYTHRKHQVAKIFHQELAKQHLFEEPYSPYYKHAPQDVLEKDNYKLY